MDIFQTDEEDLHVFDREPAACPCGAQGHYSDGHWIVVHNHLERPEQPEWTCPCHHLFHYGKCCCEQ